MNRRNTFWLEFQDECLFELAQLFGAPTDFNYSKNSIKKYTTLKNQSELNALFARFRNKLNSEFISERSFIDQQYNYLQDVAKLYFNY